MKEELRELIKSLRLDKKVFNLPENHVQFLTNEISSSMDVGGQHEGKNYTHACILFLLNSLFSNKSLDRKKNDLIVESINNVFSIFNHKAIKSFKDEDMGLFLKALLYIDISPKKKELYEYYAATYEQENFNTIKKKNDSSFFFSGMEIRDIALKEFAYLIHSLDKGLDINTEILGNCNRSNKQWLSVLEELKEIKKYPDAWKIMKVNFLAQIDSFISENRIQQYYIQDNSTSIYEEDRNILTIFSVLQERFIMAKSVVDKHNVKKEALLSLLSQKYALISSKEGIYNCKLLEEKDVNVLIFKAGDLQDDKKYKNFEDGLELMSKDILFKRYSFEEESHGILVKYEFKNEYKHKNIAKLYNQILLEKINNFIVISNRSDVSFPIDMFLSDDAFRKEREEVLTNLLNSSEKSETDRKRPKL